MRKGASLNLQYFRLKSMRSYKSTLESSNDFDRKATSMKKKNLKWFVKLFYPFIHITIFVKLAVLKVTHKSCIHSNILFCITTRNVLVVRVVQICHNSYLVKVGAFAPINFGQYLRGQSCMTSYFLGPFLTYPPYHIRVSP